MARYCLQHDGRLDAWCDKRPEYRAEVDVWRSLFYDDPWHPFLGVEESISDDGELLLDYAIAGVPIVIVVLMEHPRMGTHKVWARLLRPRDANDVLDPEDME